MTRERQVPFIVVQNAAIWPRETDKAELTTRTVCAVLRLLYVWLGEHYMKVQ